MKNNKPDTIRRLLALCALALTGWGLVSTPAQAQTPSPLAEWQYAAGIALMPRFVDEPPKWQAQFGLGAGPTPRWEGSDDTVYQGGPIINVRYKDVAFFSLGEGLGMNFASSKLWRVGGALAFDMGRREMKSTALAGMGNVKATVEPKFFTEYVIFPGVLRLDVRKAIGGHNGWIGDFSAYMPVAGTKDKKFFMFFGPSVTFADAEHMQHYFGVNAAQSAASARGYPVYTPGGGLKSGKVGTNVTWFFTEHWFLQGVAAAERLYGNADNSPLVQERDQFTGSVYVAYSW